MTGVFKVYKTFCPLLMSFDKCYQISLIQTLFWVIPKNTKEQAGAELGQAQPELGFGENDLSLRGCIRGWG